jgi:hypothetical protein
MRYAILCLLGLLAANANALFYIFARTQRFTGGEGALEDDLTSCPGSNSGCNCWGHGNGGARVADWDEQYLPDNYFTLQPFCGMPAMDFYKRNDGRWEFYVKNGNGKLEGTCYTENNPSTDSCITGPFTSATVKKLLWCNTPICG